MNTAPMARLLRWVVPAAMIVLGAAIMITGFFYDVLFAGIPFQDPTPELQASYRYHAAVASVIEVTGAMVALAGIVAGVLVVARAAVGKRRGGAG